MKSVFKKSTLAEVGKKACINNRKLLYKIPPKNDSEQDKSPKSSLAVSPPKRNDDGTWPADLTPEQVGMMSTKEATEYMGQLALTALNGSAGVSQPKLNADGS